MQRGFTNVNRKEYAIVNVCDLNGFENGTVVDVNLLKEEGLVKKEYNGVKVLGKGELNVKLTVKAAKFSETAKQVIENAGGTVEVI